MNKGKGLKNKTKRRNIGKYLEIAFNEKIVGYISDYF